MIQTLTPDLTFGRKSGGFGSNRVVKNSSDAVQGTNVDCVTLHGLDLLLDLLCTEGFSQRVLGCKELISGNKEEVNISFSE